MGDHDQRRPDPNIPVTNPRRKVCPAPGHRIRHFSTAVPATKADCPGRTPATVRRRRIDSLPRFSANSTMSSLQVNPMTSRSAAASDR